MSDSHAAAHPAGTALHTRMMARSPHEGHRAATPLELLFDLVFVVAVAQAAFGLHHAVAEGHALQGLASYAMVFFALWWAWMNFTWFASAYDCDDVPYRLAVFVQMAGALVMAAGIRGMFETQVPTAGVLGGYVLMRLAVVAQWLRAGASDPERRVTAWRYAVGVSFVQAAWVAMLLAPAGWWPVAFPILVVMEVGVPLWAERASPTTWHAGHIAERYSLLTLIVLGESVTAATTAVQAALASGETLSSLLPIIVGGLLIIYALWWMYFERPAHDLLTNLRTALIWGYGHYLIFAAAAAVGAGLSVAVDAATQHAHISAAAAGAAVTIPVAVYVLALWFLHDRPDYGYTRAFGPIAAVLTLLTSFTSIAVPLTGAILASTIALKLILRRAPAAA